MDAPGSLPSGNPLPPRAFPSGRFEQPQLPARVVRAAEVLSRKPRQLLAVEARLAAGGAEHHPKLASVLPLPGHPRAEVAVVQLAAADLADAVQHLLLAIGKVRLQPR